MERHSKGDFNIVSKGLKLFDRKFIGSFVELPKKLENFLHYGLEFSSLLHAQYSMG